MRQWPFILLLFPALIVSQESYSVKNISYKPGQKLFVGLTESDLGAPIRIQVSDAQGKSAPGVPVIFELVQKPGKAHGEALKEKMVRTDDQGIAENYFTLGDQPGDYVIIAHTEKMTGETPSILIRAQRTLWWMFLVFGLFGGIGIFLFGMKLGSTGLQKIAGERLRSILSAVTKNRFEGLLFGIFVTAVLQSSTATSVMVVGLVSSALLTLTQAISILMGAHIGTTITVQLIAFNISDYALLLVGAGFLITLVTKRKFYIYMGESLLGFGFIFFGMAVMAQSIAPLKYMPAFAGWLIEFGQNPYLGILFSMLFTAMIHSSGATIGLTVVLASEGLLTLQSALPIVLGANIGTCITALLAALGATVSGRRAAFAYTFFSVAGVILFTPFLGPFQKLVEMVTHWMGTDDPARQIANGHMLFNVLNSMILIWFIQFVAAGLTKFIPEKKGSEEFRPKYLNNAFLETPEVALQQAHLEELRLIGLAREMYAGVMDLFKPDNELRIEKIKGKEHNVNLLEFEIRKYLTRLSQKSVSLFQSHRLMRLLLTIDDLRHISERIGENFTSLAEKLVDNKWKFSIEGEKEITEFYTIVKQRLDMALDALEKENKEAAETIIRTKHEVAEKEVHFRQSHIHRLEQGLEESLVSSTIHLDMLTALKRIDTFCVKIAHEIIEQYQA